MSLYKGKYQYKVVGLPMSHEVLTELVGHVKRVVKSGQRQGVTYTSHFQGYKMVLCDGEAEISPRQGRQHV